MTLKNIFQVLVKITWQQKRRGKKSTPAKRMAHLFSSHHEREREREREREVKYDVGEENGEAEGEPSAKKLKCSSGQPNQFIVGLAGVLEQEVTENEQTDKYRPLK